MVVVVDVVVVVMVAACACTLTKSVGQVGPQQSPCAEISANSLFCTLLPRALSEPEEMKEQKKISRMISSKPLIRGLPAQLTNLGVIC